MTARPDLFCRYVLAPIACALALAGLAQAQWDNADPMVDASLVSERETVAPGETFHIALHQDITPGWHTYWQNPGDSGEPTRLSLTLPEGWQAGELIWPAPATYALGPLTNYGYADEVTLPVPVTVPESATPGPVTIEAEATWLVCEEICIPEDAELALTLTVGDSVSDRAGARLIDTALERAPVAAPQDVSAGLVRAGDRLQLSVAGGPFAAGESGVRNVYFFPHEGGLIEHSADQEAIFAPSGLALRLAPGFLAGDPVDEVHPGVLTAEFRENGRWQLRAYTIAPEPGLQVVELAAAAGTEAGRTGPTAPPGISLWQAVLFALLGGLILNLMPCVFPILSMKALHLVQKRDSDPAQARMLGLIFGAGVISTFVALGAALVVARAAGMPDLWGFQLQVPGVVAGLVLLMFLIGLNFLGAFEVGTSLQGVGGEVNPNTRAGSFLTGVLAVFVAAPCLAPFMAGALAFAIAQPPAIALVVFACLGIGLALPFVAVSFSPGLLARLPRPGPWMVRFKQVLAFPMFAVAIWLIWVLTLQTGATGMVWMLVALLATGFAIWAWQAGGSLGRVSGVLGVALVAGALVMTARLEPGAQASSQTDFEVWSPERVAQLQSEGRPVFVDFTAAWCVTCQVNKLGTLSDRDVREAFDTAGMALLRADFTNRDPVIAAALETHGSAGVPMYLVYPRSGGEPQKLPPLLTEDTVLRAIRAATANGSDAS
ncbi:thio:disulfide interchange protein [Marinicauda pacifica]|uniref:Thiol:disulfide interchange protein n=1 Tax=Marinicauda pacifica TaxID=1133559 RepID=A0A4S2H8K9_9PROT|nr:protein-disulfide reductase DsbD domain-containing protein [Marinicauda pacifica]TGY91878.1 thiol:disulfide interchange protein [Marinicauda pacifica]GGE50033.1 thio:disulfide interchange protein [Marinicauda pacifica]